MLARKNKIDTSWRETRSEIQHSSHNMRQKGTPALKFFYRYWEREALQAFYNESDANTVLIRLIGTMMCSQQTSRRSHSLASSSYKYACSESNNESPATLPSLLINGRVALHPFSLYVIHVHVACNTGKGHGNGQCLGREVSG